MKTRVNLLPWQCRRTQLIRLRVRQWLVPWGLAACGIATVLAVEWSRCCAALRQVEQLEEECSPLESLCDQNTILRRRLEELSREVEVVARLEDARPALALLGMVSQSVRDCQGQLHVESLSLRPADPVAKTPSKASAQQEAVSVSVAIKGMAADNLSVARFVAALRQTKAFDRVELKSTKEQPMGVRRVCSFQVECGY